MFSRDRICFILKCIITYQGGNRTGEYPVAIQVEDFMKASDTIPLSSVPLQFVVNVVSPSYASIPCEYLPPVFIPPTPLNGTCIPVLRGQTWNGVLLAQVQSDLARYHLKCSAYCINTSIVAVTE